MNRLFRKLAIFPIFPGFNFYPGARTFVSSTGMSAAPSTSPSWGTMSASRTPPTTMQQILGILTPPFTREKPELIENVPRVRTPLEAAQTLRNIQQAQWGRMIHGIGSEYTMEQKRAEQERLMGLERQALEQLKQFGYPVRMRFQ